MLAPGSVPPTEKSGRYQVIGASRSTWSVSTNCRTAKAVNPFETAPTDIGVVVDTADPAGNEGIVRRVVHVVDRGTGPR